ncbi:MAG: hypothetical protein NTZ67_06945, partial [Gammaproteobacteria bacterium]|nr:hypothetical protein [Gammaproteobacteria bacterium]
FLLFPVRYSSCVHLSSFTPISWEDYISYFVVFSGLVFGGHYTDSRNEESDYSNYSKTTLPTEENLFSAAFAKSIYEIMMQEATAKHTTHVSSDCQVLKEKMEAAKTVVELARVINQLYKMKNTADKNFQAAMQTIESNIQQYIVVTHPEMSDEISLAMTQAYNEYQKQSSEMWGQCCWMMLCIPNAMIQVPTLSFLWAILTFTFSIEDEDGFLSSPCSGKREKMAGFNNRACCIMPYERIAIEKNESGFFTPVASIYLAYNLCSEAGIAREIASNQRSELQYAHSLLPSTPHMR